MLFAFHNHAIAVRPSGPAHPDRPPVVLLEELYGNPQVKQWLTNHELPKGDSGPFRQRWPKTWPLTDRHSSTQPPLDCHDSNCRY